MPEIAAGFDDSRLPPLGVVPGALPVTPSAGGPRHLTPRACGRRDMSNVRAPEGKAKADAGAFEHGWAFREYPAIAVLEYRSVLHKSAASIMHFCALRPTTSMKPACRAQSPSLNTKNQHKTRHGVNRAGRFLGDGTVIQAGNLPLLDDTPRIRTARCSLRFRPDKHPDDKSFSSVFRKSIRWFERA